MQNNVFGLTVCYFYGCMGLYSPGSNFDFLLLIKFLTSTFFFPEMLNIRFFLLF